MKSDRGARTRWLLLPVLAVSATGCFPGWRTATDSRNHLIESVTDDPGDARGREYTGSKGGPECNQLTRVDTPVRAGSSAFRHWVSTCGERSELAMARTEISGTYWYGWSMLLPEDFDHQGSNSHVMQMNTWPSPRDGKFPCGGNGHKITIRSSGLMEFDLQRAGVQRDSECEKFPLGSVQQMKGKWIDFVMQGRWTGDADGFLKLWIRVGSAGYRQVIDYRGRTWWNDEDRGPYFKMGAYMGDPGWKGPPSRTLYTDEYRLGSSDARFEDVAPGRSR